MIKSLFTKFKAAVDQRKVDDQFIEEIKAALSDGVLTTEERHFILERHAELNASDKWRSIRPKLFLGAVKGAIRNEEISKAAESDLKSIREYLELNDEDAVDALKLMEECCERRNERLLLQQFEEGTFPPIAAPSFVPKRGEMFLFSTPADLYDIKTRRVYQTGSRGTSIRLAKGVSFRVGASRGYSESFEELVLVESGMLTISNSRIVFSGQLKNVSLNWEKVDSIEPYSDCIKIGVESRVKKVIFGIKRLTDVKRTCAALTGGFRLFQQR